MGRGAGEQRGKGRPKGEEPRDSGERLPRTPAPQLLLWLSGCRGDMVWNALVIVTVLLPLSGLAIDVPRYFALRSRLQIAADAGAEAAARTVDIRHYINTGETRLEPDRYAGEAAWAFETAVADLRARGYTATLDGVDLDEGADAVATRA